MLSRNLKLWRAAWLIAFLFLISAASTSHAQSSDANGNATVNANATAKSNAKPAFSLWCWKSYGTDEHAKISVNHYNLDALDFRVYRVNNPQEFFRQLKDPHQLGEADESITRTFAKREISFLERVRYFKQGIYFPIRNFLRAQLQRKTRAALKSKVSIGEDDADVKARVPLNVADFARVPLLNPNQLVSSWQEKLKPLGSEYDRRVISLGQREAGVYLVEAVHGELRAFTIVIVSDLTLIQKLAANKEMTVFAVDRRTGAPRDGVTVEVSERHELLARGVTNNDGLLRAKVKRATRDGSYTTTYDYLIMGSDKRDFIVSDLQHYSLGLYSDSSSEDRLTGYIYTDRPVYRPNQKIYFKGILRRRADDGGYTDTSNTAHVTISDERGETIYENDLPLSARGTFNGECETTQDAPLGGYNIAVSTDDGNVGGYFEVQEYKKPEYKVSVTAQDKFAPAGKQTKFTVEARYFFGAPVTRADVKYYIYRSRYYHFRGADDADAETYGADEAEQETFYGADDYGGDDGYGGYGDDLVKEGEGTLNRDGKLEVAFNVPTPDEKQPFDFTYRLQVEVTDAARRTNEGKASFTGTRGSLVADTTSDRYVYRRGDTARLRVRAADYENRPRAAKVILQFVETLYEAREVEGKKQVEYISRDKLLSTADVEINEQGEAVYDYVVPRAGSITIKTVLNESGREYVSTVDSIYATDDENDWDESLIAGEGAIKIVFDKKIYQPGETARVLCILPKDGASHLLVTTELDTLMTVRRVLATNRAVAFDVPIERRYTPNAFLSVAMVRDGELYTQDRTLVVPARDKVLSVEVIPDKQEYRPREVASYTISVRHFDGTPAQNAEVSLGVVDEAVYEIRGESAGDMRTTFYGRRYNSVSTAFAANYSFTGYSGSEALELARRTRHKPPLNSFADIKNDNQ